MEYNSSVTRCKLKVCFSFCFASRSPTPAALLFFFFCLLFYLFFSRLVVGCTFLFCFWSFSFCSVWQWLQFLLTQCLSFLPFFFPLVFSFHLQFFFVFSFFAFRYIFLCFLYLNFTSPFFLSFFLVFCYFLFFLYIISPSFPYFRLSRVLLFTYETFTSYSLEAIT